MAVLRSASVLGRRASHRAIVSLQWTSSFVHRAPPHVRSLSTNPNNDNSDSPSDSTWNRLVRQVATPKNQFYALLAGGGVLSYGLSKIFLSVTSFFTHLTPTVVAKWGFYTGFGTAGLIGGGALLAADVLYIRADPVYRYCWSKIQTSPTVLTALGDGLQPGELRSYRLDAGRFELAPGSTSSFVWRPARIQMIFDVTASGPPYRTGIVTCEAMKLWGLPPYLHTTILKVDYEKGSSDADGEIDLNHTLWLTGSPDDYTRVSKRSGLSLESIARQVHINKAAAATVNK